MIRYNKLKELNICDAYLIISEVNRFYFSGFKSSFGYVVYADNKSYYLTDFRYKEEAEAYFKGQDVEIAAGTVKEINAMLQNILNSKKIKSIGFEDNRLNFKEYNDIKKMLGCELVPIGDKIDNLRNIKDKYEIEQITAAQAITDKAFSKILNFIKPDITEKDICTELEYQMALNGSDGIAFDTIIASGNNASRPHSTVSKRKIKNGDFIILDFGAKKSGYCSDMSRTVAVGKPDDKMRNVYNLVLNAQNMALNALKTDLLCSKTFYIAKDYFTANGYGNEFLHGLGHGVGIEIHESPNLNSLSDAKLEPGMAVTIEPGIYINNAFGVRIEDLVIIGENNIKNLTVSNKELIIL